MAKGNSVCWDFFNKRNQPVIDVSRAKPRLTFNEPEWIKQETLTLRVWDLNITNKPIIAVCACEEDWSGLVVGIFTGEVTMKVVPEKPDDENYRW